MEVSFHTPTNTSYSARFVSGNKKKKNSFQESGTELGPVTLRKGLRFTDGRADGSRRLSTLVSLAFMTDLVSDLVRNEKNTQRHTTEPRLVSQSVIIAAVRKLDQVWLNKRLMILTASLSDPR